MLKQEHIQESVLRKQVLELHNMVQVQEHTHMVRVQGHMLELHILEVLDILLVVCMLLPLQLGMCSAHNLEVLVLERDNTWIQDILKQQVLD